MDRTTADITEIRVPGEDGVIVQAMAGLDERLAAWTSAMREACRHLAESAAGRMPTVVETPNIAPRPMVATQRQDRLITMESCQENKNKHMGGAEASEPPAVVAALPAPVDAHLEAASPVPAECHRQEMNVPDAAVTPPPVQAASETIRIKTATSMPAVTVEPAKAPPPTEDDETLLASLDPETAKMIRVMRRLSTERKSVREWLKEFETNNATRQSVAQPKKKSWFSRG